MVDYSYKEYHFGFSWQFFVCALVVWGIIAGIFFKYFNTPMLGKLLRYAIWTTLLLLTVCLLRFLRLPGAVIGLSQNIIPSTDNFVSTLGVILLATLLAMGPGWGSVISLASFNKFDRNIMRDSWIICLGQMLIFMALNLSTMLVDWHFAEISNEDDNYFTDHLDIYLSTASAIASMNFPNLWSLLFYAMLTLAAFIVMITQLYALLVTIFDEFEALRAYKMRVTLILIFVLMLFSIYFCSNHGLVSISRLSLDSLFTQTALNLLLMLVVLWFYGRERFQRDIQFMLRQSFGTWKIYVLRFVSPIGIIILLLVLMVIALLEHLFSNYVIAIIAAIFMLLPWLSIPAYGLFIILQNTGPWYERIKRSCRPTDWYPVEKEDRERYEEALINENITHQLNELSS